MARKWLGPSFLLAAAVAAPLAVPAAGAAASARAGTPQVVRSGAWSRVTPAKTDIIADIGLARGTDGVLHVLWTTGNSPNIRIMDTPVGKLGAVRAPVTVASGWYLASFPDAVTTSSRVTALWLGQKTSSINGPEGLFEATRPRSGGSWSPPAVAVSSQQSATSSAGSVSATASGSHTWAAFTATDTLGISAAGQPFTDIPPKTCCAYNAGLATADGAGATYVAYLSLVSHHQGIYAQKLTAAGKASGAAVRLPGSATDGNVVSAEQRTGLTGRGKGRAGVYAAYGSGYPALRRVDVVRVGAAKPKVLARASGGAEVGPVTITADPQGRLWAAWVIVRSGRPHLYLSRSSKSATSFGKTRSVALPAGTAEVWKLYLSAESGRADVLALTSRSVTGPAAYWSRMVTPAK